MKKKDLERMTEVASDLSETANNGEGQTEGISETAPDTEDQAQKISEAISVAVSEENFVCRAAKEAVCKALAENISGEDEEAPLAKRISEAMDKIKEDPSFNDCFEDKAKKVLPRISVPYGKTVAEKRLYSFDELKQMSAKEINKNWDRVKLSLERMNQIDQ